MTSDQKGNAAQKAPDITKPMYLYESIRTAFDEDALKKAVVDHIEALAQKFNVTDYALLFLMDAKDSLSSWHSNRIYKAASTAKRTKPILLVLHSHGGSIEAGYLISKTCKRLAKDKFLVSIPRKAKSAATLLSLGADEIHMGLMSELGPIDPQIGGFPALGVKNALEILSDLACKHPGASSMLGQYLQGKLDMHILGYFERINESAMQYAERLLAGKAFPPNQTGKTLAGHFVNHYKDHGFVIDFDEASALLGSTMVKQETQEYEFANAVFESLEFIRLLLDVMYNKDADLVGTVADGFRTFDIKKDSQ